MIDAVRDCYHGPVGAYISTFIEVAAQAGGEGEEPGAELGAGMADLNALYRAAQEWSGGPHLLAAPRLGSLLLSRYCAATVCRC